jgi:hypothetical protein
MTLRAIIVRVRKALHGETQGGRYDPIPPARRATDQEIEDEIRNEVYEDRMRGSYD